MKLQIRQGLFETNSSSVHSITICSDNEFQDWVNDVIRFSHSYSADKFLPRDEAIEENIKLAMKEYNLTEKNTKHREIIEQYRNTGDINTFAENIDDNYFDKYEYYLTYDEWYDFYDYEKFEKEYVTQSGDKIVAFGYYGNDY